MSVPVLERPLPMNLEAECSVLGAILLDGKNLNRVTERLKPHDFFHDSHQRIFNHAIQLGESVDVLTLTDHLRGKGELDAAGGAAYLSQLIDGVPRVSNVEHYAKIVKDHSIRRSVIHAYESGMSAAFDSEAAVDEILERTSNTVTALREICSPGNSFKAPTIAELLAQAPAKPEYLIDGLIPKGMVIATLGKIKAGKTTFKLKAIEAILTGQPFLKLETTPTQVLWVTEQSKQSFLAQVQKARLCEPAVRGIRLITHYDLRSIDWAARARLIGEQAALWHAGLVVVDTFSRVAGVREENDAGEMQGAVDVLQNFIPEGITLDLTQHERKSGGEIEDAGRGTSALGGCVDVLLRITRVAGQDRRRDIQTMGRPWTAFEDAQRIELCEDDGAYSVLGSASASTVRDLESQISALWPGSPLTIDEVTERTGGSRSNVQRSLDKLIRDGIVCAMGEGKKGDPKRYMGVEP